MREGLLLGRFLLPIIAAASRRGLDPLRWQWLGIEPHRLTALDTMLPSGCVYRFLEELAPHCDIEELAIEVATSTSVSDLGLLGLMLRAAPTERQALLGLVRYQHLV